MGKQQDRADAVTALIASWRTQKAALAAALVGVAVNTITQPQIDSITAVGVAYDTAITTAGAACRAAEGS